MKMTEKEKKDLDELYLYLKDILKLGEDENLSRPQMVRLNGLHNGKYMGNNRTFNYANIGYDIILMTLRLHRSEIDSGLSKYHFNNDMHRFNYICKIIENNISDTYKLIENQKSTEENKDIIFNTNTETRNARDTEKYKNLHKTKEITDESLWGDL